MTITVERTEVSPDIAILERNPPGHVAGDASRLEGHGI